ncbi:hypothetical protein LIER_12439 [Lithospermum erythrorhizon]|uniref:Uncharacterized protein n=1 Tax=Lithospermum erythrorhizon TaxID=34254 RepID=A0AAV3PWY9_LITER
MDDSQGFLDVMPLRSIIGPPANVPPTRGQQVTQSETSKSKRSKDPPTLDQVRAKTVPGLITEAQLRAIRNHYDFSDEGLSATSKWLLPNITSYTPRRWIKLRPAVGSGCGFWPKGDSGMTFVLISPWPILPFMPRTLPRHKGDIDKLRAGFPEAIPHEVFCDRDVLIKAGLTKGADNFPKFKLLALLSHKHAFGNCTMPHKVAYKSITSGKDVLARVSKRKGSSVLESSTTTGKAKKALKVKVYAAALSVTTPPEATPSVPEAVVEAFGPPSLRAQHPITIVIPDQVSPSSGKSDSSSLPPPESASGSDGPWLPIPYTLLSGVTETEDTVSKVNSSTTSLLMKKMYATECTYGLSLKWKEAEKSLAKLADEKTSLEERLNEALSLADNVESKY